MSTIEAPSSSSRRAAAIATSGRRCTPPSAKLSGVTLTIPITAGRRKRSSSGDVSLTMDVSSPGERSRGRRAALLVGLLVLLLAAVAIASTGDTPLGAGGRRPADRLVDVAASLLLVSWPSVPHRALHHAA